MQADGQNELTANDQDVPRPGGWLNRNVLGMALTSLLCDAGHEMATAVLAGFLAVIGTPVYALGLIEGVSDALSSFVKLGAGWWSDRLGHRKAITTAGYALTGSALGLFALAASWPLVLLGRMLAWFGRGIRSPLRSTMLADQSRPPTGARRRFPSRRRYAGSHSRSARGRRLDVPARRPTPWGILRSLSDHLPGDLGAGVGRRITFRGDCPRKAAAGLARRRFWTSVRAAETISPLSGGHGRFAQAIFPHALDPGGREFLAGSHGTAVAAQITALLYALRNTLHTAIRIRSARLSDRFGRRGILVFGYVLGAIVMLGFVAAFRVRTESIVFLGVLFALAGIFIAIEESLEGAMTANLVPDESNRGTAYGVMGIVNGIGDFLSQRHRWAALVVQSAGRLSVRRCDDASGRGSCLARVR